MLTKRSGILLNLVITLSALQTAILGGLLYSFLLFLTRLFCRGISAAGKLRAKIGVGCCSAMCAEAGANQHRARVATVLAGFAVRHMALLFCAIKNHPAGWFGLVIAKGTTATNVQPVFAKFKPRGNKC